MDCLFVVLTIVTFFYSITCCEVNDGYIDEFIGRMDLNPHLYCDPRNHRNVYGVSCCAPKPPTGSFPKFYLYTAGPILYTKVLDWRNPEDAKYIPKDGGRVFFLIHELHYSSQNSAWVRMAAGLFNRNYKLPAIAVDWCEPKDHDDVHAMMANLRTVGRVVAYAIKNWHLQNLATVVGFGLGAHAVGEAGRAAQHLYGYRIQECIGLEPTGEGFDSGSPYIRLNRDSCNLVQVVHTSAAYAADGMETKSGRWGTFWKSGHCDWWVNCGHQQAPCYTTTLNEGLVRKGFPPTLLDGEAESVRSPQPCAHFQAHQIYTTFLAQECSFKSSLCENCGGTECVLYNDQKTQPFLQCNPLMNASFYVKTAPFPYCSTGGIPY